MLTNRLSALLCSPPPPFAVRMRCIIICLLCSCARTRFPPPLRFVPRFWFIDIFQRCCRLIDRSGVFASRPLRTAALVNGISPQHTRLPTARRHSSRSRSAAHRSSGRSASSSRSVIVTISLAAAAVLSAESPQCSSSAVVCYWLPATAFAVVGCLACNR
jgi:hypothetical protein